MLLSVNLGVDLDGPATVAPLSINDLSGMQLSSMHWGDRDVTVYAGEWLVRLDPGGGPASLAESLASAERLFAGSIPGFEQVQGLASNDTFLIRTAADYSFDTISGLLAGIDGFATVEPNFLAWKDETTPNDASFGDQWALENVGQLGGVVDADIDAPLAWDINTGSGKTVVGVVDSGVNYNHVDLNDNMWHNPGEIPGDGLDNDGNGFVDDYYGYDFLNGDSNPFDDEGHGTSVAGIIAAEGNNGIGVSGVNWDAQIMALKIFGPGGFAGTAQIVGAINYATMMKRDYGVDVIATNHSWGTVGFSTVLRDAIAEAGAEDILFVASAGNAQHDNDVAPQYPASYDLDNVISVAATDRFDALASFSSYGATAVDLGAPGVSTLTTAMSGGYRNFGGTSAAAPYVAAVAALVHDTFPNASALEVKQAILDGTDPIPALANITLSEGRLNVFGAFEAMQTQVVAASPDAGDILDTPPLAFTIETAFPVDPATVDPADLTVNGLPADNVAVIDNTITFGFNSSPVTVEGPQQMHIAEGAFSRLGVANGVKQFDATFYYDTLRLHYQQVAITLPQPPALMAITFNENIDPASVELEDLVLSHGSATGFRVAGDTIEFDITGITSDIAWTVSMPAGAVNDTFGNPSEAFSAPFELDFDRDAAPFTRLEPLGGMIFSSRNEGRFRDVGDTDQFEFFVEAGQTIAVSITPSDPLATVNARLDGIGDPAVSLDPGDPAVIGPTPIGSDGVVTLIVQGTNRITDYQVEIIRNAAIENPLPFVPQNITASAITVGSRRFGVVGSIDHVLQTDTYALDLSVSLGRPVDIVLAGQHGVSFETATLELVAPDGSIVVATADPLGNGATNYDLAILGFVPDQIGDYQLRLTSAVLGQYAVVVTERLLFESEVNDGPLGQLRSVDAVGSVAGFIDSAGQTGLFEFAVDTSQSSVTISGGVGNADGTLLLEFTEQGPGSLYSDLTGEMRAVVSNDTITLLSNSTVFSFEKPGPFQPGNAPADYAANFELPPIIVGGVIALRDTVFGAVSEEIALDGSGHFAADALSFTVGGIISADLPGVFDEAYGIDSTYVDNQHASPGTLELVDGQYVLTVPIHVRLLIPVPQLPLAGVFDIDGQIVAKTIVPGPDDLYAITLAEGQTVTVETRTPFDNPASTPGNPLDPAIEIQDGAGVPLDFDDNSADGRNARLSFTAPQAGVYRIAVKRVAGEGEYILKIDGHAGSEPGPFDVIAIDPNDGALLEENISELVVDFSDIIDPLTIGAGDLTVDGVAADSVETVDANTLRFAFAAPLGEGEHVVALAGGALMSTDGVALSAFVSSFRIDALPPSVAAVMVAGTQWSGAFFDYLETAGLGSGGYAIPTGSGEQLAALPWVNIDQLKIRFSEDVSVDQGDLALSGVEFASYGFADFSYDNATFTATWTIDAAFLNPGTGGLAGDRLLIELDDAVIDFVGNALDGEFVNPPDVPASASDSLPSGDGRAGGDFLFRFDALPGDVNQSGDVADDDLTLVRDSQFRSPGQGGYNVLFDVNGSASIFGDDVLLVRNRKLDALPAESPVIPPAVPQSEVDPDADGGEGALFHSSGANTTAGTIDGGEGALTATTEQPVDLNFGLTALAAAATSEPTTLADTWGSVLQRAVDRAVADLGAEALALELVTASDMVPSETIALGPADNDADEGFDTDLDLGLDRVGLR